MNAESKGFNNQLNRCEASCMFVVLLIFGSSDLRSSLIMNYQKFCISYHS